MGEEVIEQFRRVREALDAAVEMAAWLNTSIERLEAQNTALEARVTALEDKSPCSDLWHIIKGPDIPETCTTCGKGWKR